MRKKQNQNQNGRGQKHYPSSGGERATARAYMRAIGLYVMNISTAELRSDDISTMKQVLALFNFVSCSERL